MTYLARLPAVAKSDVDSLIESEKSYKDSWKRRGGVGAFMMLARKWDRLEEAMTTDVSTEELGDLSEYDVFNRTEVDPRPEGIIDDIRDLRRYLMLVESELLERGITKPELIE